MSIKNIYINNATILFSRKNNRKMIMPRKLHLYATSIMTWCHVFSLQLEFYVTCLK